MEDSNAEEMRKKTEYHKSERVNIDDEFEKIKNDILEATRRNAFK